MRPGEVIYEKSFTLPAPIPPIDTSDEGFIREIVRWLASKAIKILREADIHAKIRASPRKFIYRDLGDHVRIIDDGGNEAIIDKSGRLKMVIIGADLDEWNSIEIVFTFEDKTVAVRVIYAD